MVEIILICLATTFVLLTSAGVTVQREGHQLLVDALGKNPLEIKPKTLAVSMLVTSAVLVIWIYGLMSLSAKMRMNSVKNRAIHMARGCIKDPWELQPVLNYINNYGKERAP